MNYPFTVVLHDATEDSGDPEAYPIYWVEAKTPERAGDAAAIKSARIRGYSDPKNERLNIVAIFPGFLLCE